MSETTTKTAEPKEEVNLDGLLAKRDELLAEKKKIKADYEASLKENEDLRKALQKFGPEKTEAERIQLEKQGEFEKLYKESEMTKQQIAKEKAELEKIVNEHKAQMEKERQDLLMQLPDDERELWKDLKKEQLQALIAKKNPIDSLTTPKQSPQKEDIDLNDVNSRRQLLTKLMNID